MNRLETPADAIRHMLDIYGSSLKDYMDDPDVWYINSSFGTNDGLCWVLGKLYENGVLCRYDQHALLDRIKSRVMDYTYLCVTPLLANTHNDRIRSYQTRINLLEEILIEVTPVDDEEEELGTFEKFNNILY